VIVPSALAAKSYPCSAADMRSVVDNAVYLHSLHMDGSSVLEWKWMSLIGGMMDVQAYGRQ
jgi:hypothetical protein